MLIVFLSFLAFIGIRELGTLGLEYLLLTLLRGNENIGLMYQIGSKLITCLLALPAFLAIHRMLSFRDIKLLFSGKDNAKPPVLLATVLLAVTLLPTLITFGLGSASPPLDVISAIWMVLLTPVIEEVVFRGVLLNKLKPYGMAPAVVITAILFSVGHMDIANMLISLLPGVFLAMIALKSGSIRYTVPLHMLVNLCGNVLLPYIFSLTS